MDLTPARAATLRSRGGALGSAALVGPSRSGAPLASASSTGTIGCPDSGDAVSRWLGEDPAARDALPEPSQRTSRSSTSARTGSRATSSRSSARAPRRGSRSSSTRTAWAIRDGRAIGHGGRESPAPIAPSCGRPRALPERVLQAVGRRVGRPTERDLGGPATTPSTRLTSRPTERHRRAARPGPAARRRSDAGIPPRARTRHARRARARRIRTPSCS